MTDYEQARHEFNPNVPELFNWTRDVFGRWAANPLHLAMLWVGQNADAGGDGRAGRGDERLISFADFDRRSNQVAAALRDAGVGPGDRVAVILPRVPEWWEAMARHHEAWCYQHARHDPPDPQRYCFPARHRRGACCDK